jgi:hypothetical protein
MTLGFSRPFIASMSEAIQQIVEMRRRRWIAALLRSSR